MPDKNYITKVLGIQGFLVKDLKISIGRVDIYLEREQQTYCCSRCGQISYLSWGSWEIEVQDLKMSGNGVYLHFRKHRVKCSCNENAYVERLDFVDEEETVTKRLEEEIYGLCKMMPIKAVAGIYKLDWDTVKRLDKKNILKRVAAKDRFKYLTGISVDAESFCEIDLKSVC